MADELAVYDPIADDPAIYTRRPVSPEEHVLAELADGHDDGAVPFHYFAKVAVRLKRLGQWAHGLESLRQIVRRNARAGLGMLAANAVLIVGFVLHRVSAEATAAEHAAAQERADITYRQGVQEDKNRMEQEILYLRRRLDRLTGLEPSGPSGDYRDTFPNKLSSLNLKGPSCTFASRYPSLLP